MGLNDRPVIHPQFTEAMQNKLTGHERARVLVFDPNSEQRSTDLSERFDPRSGTKGNSGKSASRVWPTLNDTDEPNNAWLQVLGDGADIDGRDPASSEVVLRIHLDRNYFGPADQIASGFQVYIVRGGDDISFNGRTAIVRRSSVASTSVNRTLVCTMSEKR